MGAGTGCESFGGEGSGDPYEQVYNETKGTHKINSSTLYCVSMSLSSLFIPQTMASVILTPFTTVDTNQTIYKSTHHIPVEGGEEM